MAAPMAACDRRLQAIAMSGSSRIVCGIDDSPGARDAARTAAKLSEGLGLPLQLVHVARATAPGHLTAYSAPASEEEQLRKGALLLREVVEELAIRAEHRLELGEPAERLAEIAKDERSPMLVVGSRGHGGFRASMLGSVSRQLVATAPCPLIVVPPPPADRTA